MISECDQRECDVVATLLGHEYTHDAPAQTVPPDARSTINLFTR